MPDLDALRDFALQRGHNLTHPLRHEQVVELATAWFPDIRFHPAERFHPLDLSGLVGIPPDVFVGLPESVKEEFRVDVHTATLNNGQQIIEHFDPPVVHIDSGNAQRVLGSGANVANAMVDSDLTRDAIFTYGARLEAGRQFFGASNTVLGATEPKPGDPRLPRHLPMVVRAELRMLLETLKHELELDSLESPLKENGQPIDAIWSGFAVEESLFVDNPNGGGGMNPPEFDRSQKRKVLAALVDARLANDGQGDPAAELAALNQIPPGFSLSQRAWDAVTQYAFLEFYFVYAFNDYKQYGTWPFENEHEGDVEGCCVVFERSDLEALAAGTKTAEQVTGHTVITSVHQEFNDSDRLKRLPLANDKAHDDLVVYVASGSHATYLTVGSHDVLSFEDVFIDLPSQLPGWVEVLGTITLILPTLALLAGIIEYFVDSEDETSDNGVSIGPGEPDPENLKLEKQLEVTPLSNVETDVNIYQDVFLPTRAIRGYHGKWGGDEGTIDFSSPWENKTARYFRRFLEAGQIKPSVVLL